MKSRMRRSGWWRGSRRQPLPTRTRSPSRLPPPARPSSNGLLAFAAKRLPKLYRERPGSDWADHCKAMGDRHNQCKECQVQFMPWDGTPLTPGHAFVSFL